MKEAVQAAVQESQSVAAKSAPVEQLDQVKRDVDDLKGNATSMAFNLQETQKTAREQAESPLALHFKGVTITPGGFMAFETVYRNRALGADINTPFNSIQFPGSGQNALSSFMPPAANPESPCWPKASSATSNSRVVEADFLGWCHLHNNQSSTATPATAACVGDRRRITTDDYRWPMWSLVTETKKGPRQSLGSIADDD